MINEYLTYETNVKGLATTTIEEYRKDLTAFVKWTRKGKTPLRWSYVTPSIIELFITNQRRRGLKATTINRRTSALSGFFDYLCKRHGLKSNPVEELDRMKQAKTQPKPADGDAVRAYLEDATKNDRWQNELKAIVALMMGTGLRISEALAITMADVDGRDKRITIHGKGAKERYVYYGQDIAQRLNAYYLATGKRGPQQRLFTMSYDDAYKMMTAELRGANGRGITPHQLRHTFATEQLRKGTPIKTLASMMGHERITTTERYTAIGDAERRERFLA